eukprot:scaffold2066_cov171-Skeletonema_dohrnii-CCMP3373.AAC.2
MDGETTNIASAYHVMIRENITATEPAFMTNDGGAPWCGSRESSTMLVKRHDSLLTCPPSLESITLKQRISLDGLS